MNSFMNNEFICEWFSQKKKYEFCVPRNVLANRIHMDFPLDLIEFISWKVLNPIFGDQDADFSEIRAT